MEIERKDKNVVFPPPSGCTKSFQRLVFLFPGESLISVMRLIESFKYAFTGIGFMLKEAKNFRVQLACFILVLFLAVTFHCVLWEWCVLLLSTALVLIAEIINSAIEYLCNHVTPEKHPDIKRIKDVAAAAPLVASIFALVIGIFIFTPKIFFWMQG